MVVAGRSHRQAGRRAGEGRVDARRRHPARHLSPGLSRHDFGEPVGRQDRRLEISRHAARRSSRAGCRRPSRTASTSTPSIAPSTCPTTSPTSVSNMCAPSRRPCRPASGAGSGPTTTSSPSNASWTSWRARRARTRSTSAATCSARSRACWPRSISWPRNPTGASRCRARVGRGVSVQPSFASFIATVVEAEVDEQGEVHLRRVTSAVDTGIAVNPDTIAAQLQGGLIFGLTAALYGEITIDKGRVQQSNFNDYRMLRIDEVPQIDVHVIKSGEAPGGIGETGATAGPPALRNAIYAATGVALRRLPIDRDPDRREEKVMRPAVRTIARRRRRDRRGGGCRRPLDPARARAPWPLPAARRWRWRIIAAPIPPAFRRRLPRRASSSAASISRARRIAWSATPHRAARNMPAAWRSSCRSARSIRPTSRRTRRPASATTAIGISWTRCIAASRRDGARLYPAMPYHVLHLHHRCRCAGDQGLSVQPAAGARVDARRIR